MNRNPIPKYQIHRNSASYMESEHVFQYKIIQRIKVDQSQDRD